MARDPQPFAAAYYYRDSAGMVSADIYERPPHASALQPVARTAPMASLEGLLGVVARLLRERS